MTSDDAGLGSGDKHGQTWGEAADEGIAKVAMALAELEELEVAIMALHGPEPDDDKAREALETIREEQAELAEAGSDLIEQREMGPFERLSDEQLETFREMYGSVIPDE